MNIKARPGLIQCNELVTAGFGGPDCRCVSLRGVAVGSGAGGEWGGGGMKPAGWLGRAGRVFLDEHTLPAQLH